MTLNELEKQATDLRNAILRLCSESDNDHIIICALLSSLVEIAAANNLSPNETAKMSINYIFDYIYNRSI